MRPGRRHLVRARPSPALTTEAWHLFAVFAGAISSVIVNAFPLLTASLLAVGTVVLTGTVDPAKAFAGFANASVLLVIVAFLVANAVVKCGLGSRISLLVVSVCGRSTLGLGYSICLADALIAPAFPGGRRHGGVLYPIILSLRPERRLHAKTPASAVWAAISCSVVWRRPSASRRSLAHGHLRQPDRRLAGRAVRLEDRLRAHLVAGRFGSSPGHRPAAAAGPCLAFSTGVTAMPGVAGVRAENCGASRPPRATNGSSL